MLDLILMVGFVLSIVRIPLTPFIEDVAETSLIHCKLMLARVFDKNLKAKFDQNFNY